MKIEEFVREIRAEASKISNGVLPGHPAYEDYLDAVAYSLEIKAVGETLRQKIHEFLS